MSRFEYGKDVEQKTIDTCEASVVRIEKSRWGCVESLIEIGAELEKIRAKLDKGDFGDWCNHYFDWSRSVAYKFIRVNKVFGNRLADANSPLKISIDTLYLIAGDACPKKAQDELIDRALEGEKITERAAKELIAAHSPKKPPKPPKPVKVRCLGCDKKFEPDDERIVGFITCVECREKEAAENTGVNPNGPPVPTLSVPGLNVSLTDTNELVESDLIEKGQADEPGFGDAMVAGTGTRDPRAYVRKVHLMLMDMPADEMNAVLQSLNECYPQSLVDAWECGTEEQQHDLREHLGDTFTIKEPIEAVRDAYDRATKSERQTIKDRVKGWAIIRAADEEFDSDSAFDMFWHVVHRKTAKGDAKKAFAKAVAAKAVADDISQADAAKAINEAMNAFRESPAANPTDHSPIHPATWLNGGRYDDDRETWVVANGKGNF